MELRQVQKRTAEKMYNKGFTIRLCPCKVNPYQDRFTHDVNKNNFENDYTFEKLINNFIYYNCNYAECGLYPHYYVLENENMIL